MSGVSRTETAVPSTLVGLKARYFEDDWIARVTILADTSDAEWERYRLRVDSTERESRLYTPTPDGEEFDVDKKRGLPMGMIWTLALT